MSSSRPSLRDRYAQDLRSGSTPALLTTIAIAVAAAIGSALYVEEVTVGFLLLILIGIHVPTAHERHWPASPGRLRGVAWIVAASAVVLVLFGVGYVLAGSVLADPIWLGAAAYLFATIVGGLSLWALRLG